MRRGRGGEEVERKRRGRRGGEEGVEEERKTSGGRRGGGEGLKQYRKGAFRSAVFGTCVQQVVCG